MAEIESRVNQLEVQQKQLRENQRELMRTVYGDMSLGVEPVRQQIEKTGRRVEELHDQQEKVNYLLESQARVLQYILYAVVCGGLVMAGVVFALMYIITVLP